MKIIRYTPIHNPQEIFTSHASVPVEALSEIIFHHTSLEDALEEIRREGYASPREGGILEGVKDLLEKTRKIRTEAYGCPSTAELSPTSTDGNGPLKSGVSWRKAKTGVSSGFIDEHTNHFHKLETLEKSLKRVYWGYDYNSIDETLLEELLGAQSLDNWQLIKNLTSLMLNQGLAERGHSGLALTSLGLQKCAWNILKEIFTPGKTDSLSRRLNSELSTEPYLTEGSRPYCFGDPPLIDPCQSLLNAIGRSGTGLPVQLEEKDFVVYQKETLSKYATVLLLDLSKSMRFENRYIAAKKVTLALHEMVRKRYPKDRIAAVGFSTKAHKIRSRELPFLTWDETNPYTNMEEALDLSQKILSLHKGYRKQVFLITDGEPTAHRERGYLFFQFPPHPKTLAKTLTRLQGLARHNIDISIFLLSQEKERISFVHEMARRCNAKVFHIAPGELGRCLLMDYLNKKSKWL